MNKKPAFQFYPGDWLRDTELQICNASTRGIWINFLCRMFDSREIGKLEGTKTELCLLAGCTQDELERFLEDAERTKFCEVSVRSNGDLQNSTENLTIINRRMFKEEKERISGRERANRHYKRKKECKEFNGDSTKTSRPHSSSSASSSASERERREKETDSELPPLCPFSRIIKIYEKNCPALNKVRELSSDDEGNLKILWKRHSDLDYWENYFKNVAKSDFLMGRAKDFQSDFQWLINPGNFAKVVNGRYGSNKKEIKDKNPNKPKYIKGFNLYRNTQIKRKCTEGHTLELYKMEDIWGGLELKWYCPICDEANQIDNDKRYILFKVDKNDYETIKKEIDERLIATK